MNRKHLKRLVSKRLNQSKTEADLTNFRKILTKITVETALNAKLDEHLGYSRHEQSQQNNYYQSRRWSSLFRCAT
ncbi:hypothetical protein [Colwellia sp. PAMC 20917]|uniref:hypothetical protein n=1 Tax=Colwellia sp. PAMC 20917 TaxID=1816218 RepID=UPI0012FC71C4|nr:hypothetical protein [Colwellia sp. PAMC 20917]